MKSMRHVWIVTIAGAVIGIALWWLLWTQYGADAKAGRLGDTALGFWVIFTQKGKAMWLPYLLAGGTGALVAFLFGRNSLKSRQWREVEASKAAAVPHPMD